MDDAANFDWVALKALQHAVRNPDHQSRPAQSRRAQPEM